MADKKTVSERPVLSDKECYPDDDVLQKHLGKAFTAWKAFIELLQNDYPLITTEWRYYNDYKSWLFKVTKKSKTICWVSVWDKYFRIVFYFARSAEDEVKKSPVNKDIKALFRDKSNLRKNISVVLPIKKGIDLKTVKQLIEIKEKLK